MLWFRLIAVPHAILLLPLAWSGGIVDSTMFMVYSLAVASAYLGLELRKIDGPPFSTPVEASQMPYRMPLIVVSGFFIAAVLAIQHFLIFRWHAAVVAATLLIGLGALFLTRSSLRAFEGSIRYNLGLLTTESTVIYKEVDI
jgi:hypothetical protein